MRLPLIIVVLLIAINANSKQCINFFDLKPTVFSMNSGIGEWVYQRINLEPGRELNFSISIGMDNKYVGEVFEGPSELKKESGPGAGSPESNITRIFSTELETRVKGSSIYLAGENKNNPDVRLIYKFKLSSDLPTRQYPDFRLDLLKVRRQNNPKNTQVAGFNVKKLSTQMKYDSNTIKPEHTKFKTPLLKGEPAKQILLLLQENHFPNLDINPVTYRGLRLQPFSLRGEESYIVDFSKIVSRAQVIDILNGFLSLGLPIEHPVFDGYR